MSLNAADVAQIEALKGQATISALPLSLVLRFKPLMKHALLPLMLLPLSLQDAVFDFASTVVANVVILVLVAMGVSTNSAAGQVAVPIVIAFVLVLAIVFRERILKSRRDILRASSILALIPFTEDVSDVVVEAKVLQKPVDGFKGDFSDDDNEDEVAMKYREKPRTADRDDGGIVGKVIPMSHNGHEGNAAAGGASISASASAGASASASASASGGSGVGAGAMSSVGSKVRATYGARVGAKKEEDEIDEGDDVASGGTPSREGGMENHSGQSRGNSREKGRGEGSAIDQRRAGHRNSAGLIFARASDSVTGGTGGPVVDDEDEEFAFGSRQGSGLKRMLSNIAGRLGLVKPDHNHHGNGAAGNGADASVVVGGTAARGNAYAAEESNNDPANLEEGAARQHNHASASASASASAAASAAENGDLDRYLLRPSSERLIEVEEARRDRDVNSRSRIPQQSSAASTASAVYTAAGKGHGVGVRGRVGVGGAGKFDKELEAPVKDAWKTAEAGHYDNHHNEGSAGLAGAVAGAGAGAELGGGQHANPHRPPSQDSQPLPTQQQQGGQQQVLHQHEMSKLQSTPPLARRMSNSFIKAFTSLQRTITGKKSVDDDDDMEEIDISDNNNDNEISKSNANKSTAVKGGRQAATHGTVLPGDTNNGASAAAGAEASAGTVSAAEGHHTAWIAESAGQRPQQQQQSRQLHQPPTAPQSRAPPVTATQKFAAAAASTANAADTDADADADANSKVGMDFTKAFASASSSNGNEETTEKVDILRPRFDRQSIKGTTATTKVVASDEKRVGKGDGKDDEDDEEEDEDIFDKIFNRVAAKKVTEGQPVVAGRSSPTATFSAPKSAGGGDGDSDGKTTTNTGISDAKAIGGGSGKTDRGAGTEAGTAGTAGAGKGRRGRGSVDELMAMFSDFDDADDKQPSTSASASASSAAGRSGRTPERRTNNIIGTHASGAGVDNVGINRVGAGSEKGAGIGAGISMSGREIGPPPRSIPPQPTRPSASRVSAVSAVSSLSPVAAGTGTGAEAPRGHIALPPFHAPLSIGGASRGIEGGGRGSVASGAGTGALSGASGAVGSVSSVGGVGRRRRGRSRGSDKGSEQGSGVAEVNDDDLVDDMGKLNVSSDAAEYYQTTAQPQPQLQVAPPRRRRRPSNLPSTSASTMGTIGSIQETDEEK
jgi:hypothetical protein